MTLEQLLTGRECPPCTSTVPGHLVSYAPDQVNITFDLYQGLPRCAVYIGSAKIPLTRQEHFTAQITGQWCAPAAALCILTRRHMHPCQQQAQPYWHVSNPSLRRPSQGVAAMTGLLLAITARMHLQLQQ